MKETPRLEGLRKRRRALKEGLFIYDGLPCYACKETSRYVADNSCVACGNLKTTAERTIPVDPHPPDGMELVFGTCIGCKARKWYKRKDGSRWCIRCRAPLVQGLKPVLRKKDGSDSY